MDDTSGKFDWAQARAFWVTAEEGSFSAAARALNLTQPTLGRQVAGLEEALGVTLFERVGRGLVLTQAGLDLLEHVQAMGDAAQRMSLAASGQSQEIAGQVRITASDVFAAYLLPDILARLHAAAPGLQIDVVAANDIRDLQRREADIAIRHVRPDQPHLIGKRVREATGRFYASKDYVGGAGCPDGPGDTPGHRFVGFGDIDRMIAFLKDIGMVVAPAQFAVQSENGLVAWELVKRGFGIAAMAEEIGNATPEVMPVFASVPPIRFPVWLVTHRELHTSRRIRVVFDALAEGLRHPPTRTPRD